MVCVLVDALADNRPAYIAYVVEIYVLFALGCLTFAHITYVVFVSVNAVGHPCSAIIAEVVVIGILAYATANAGKQQNNQR